MKVLLGMAVLMFNLSSTATASSTLCGWLGYGEGLVWLQDKNPSGQARTLEFTSDGYNKATNLMNEIFRLGSDYRERNPVQYVTSTFYEASVNFCACLEVTQFNRHEIKNYRSNGVKFQDPGVCYADLGRP